MKLGRLAPRTFLGPETHSDLKKQSPWGGERWKPGMIPRKAGHSIIPVSVPFDQPETPYGTHLGVQKPATVDNGYSPIKIVDSEGHETKVKQK